MKAKSRTTTRRDTAKKERRRKNDRLNMYLLIDYPATPWEARSGRVGGMVWYCMYPSIPHFFFKLQERARGGELDMVSPRIPQFYFLRHSLLKIFTCSTCINWTSGKKERMSRGSWQPGFPDPLISYTIASRYPLCHSCILLCLVVYVVMKFGWTTYIDRRCRRGHVNDYLPNPGT